MTEVPNDSAKISGRPEPSGPEATSSQDGNKIAPQSPRANLMPVPGVAAICLYLLILAAAIVFGVVIGHHYPAAYLCFAAAFVTASFGLLLLLRWAWALALSAVFLLTGYNFWIFSTLHQFPALVQGLLNLIFFLYLIRPEVRSRLR